jgi:hypothetical protein
MPLRAGSPRALLHAQRDHGRDVAEVVEQPGLVAAFGGVLQGRRPHQRAVETQHHPADQQVTCQRDQAQFPREEHDGHAGADQVHRIFQVDELALREVVQG